MSIDRVTNLDYLHAVHQVPPHPSHWNLHLIETKIVKKKKKAESVISFKPRVGVQT